MILCLVLNSISHFQYLKMDSDPFLKSFYSSVVNAVISGIKEEENEVDDATAESIKEAWIEEYKKISGIELNIDEESHQESENEQEKVLEPVY